MVENLRSHNPLKPMSFEQRRALQAYTRLSRIAMHADVVPTDKPLDQVFYKPLRELQKQQRDIFKQYGYDKDTPLHMLRSRVAIAKTAGAVALYYGTADYLDLRSHRLDPQAHRFIFYEGDAGLNYSRVPFDADNQVAGSREINVSGLDDIATEPLALNELTQLAVQLKDMQPNGWGGNHLSQPFEFSA